MSSTRGTTATRRGPSRSAGSTRGRAAAARHRGGPAPGGRAGAARGRGCRTSAGRSSGTPRATATRWCGSSPGTASGPRCTRSRRCPTSAPGKGPKLKPGMVLAIEPMVNAGASGIKMDPDGWTARTEDGSLSAHFEFSVAVTAVGARVLGTDSVSDFKERKDVCPRKKRRSRSRRWWWSRSPTRCSASRWSSTATSTRSWRTSRGRCGSTSSASCPATGCWSSCRRTTSTGAASSTDLK